MRALLVANRGEIARRVFRTARSIGLRTAAVYVDADAGEPFVAQADEAVGIPSYLDGEAIVAAAARLGTDAVHPGYGFLSENADFARSVVAAGLLWIGPAPDTIAAMGDKLAAKRIAADAGVPILPSSADPGSFAEVGFPLMVKAAAGGGGKGMRIVETASELTDAIGAARREARAGFGDDRVFAERYVPRARHIEIQILGDTHGTVVHLGERECSIQRRHQKIIEESPSTFVSPDRRAEMGGAAVRLATALGYESAGTVEFLVDDETGEFWFLEVNTRLQVEHPVTEAVTGVDLVREQIRIARGEPLGFGQDAVVLDGAAIEARLYAEDPASGFLPATGILEAFDPPGDPAVRWDCGVEVGSVIGVDFDPMIAKVIAHAPTRSEAAGALALALERLHVGGVITNRDFLAAVLRSEAFHTGDTTTDFIERVRPATTREISEDEARRLAVAGALWVRGANRADADVLAHLPGGWLIGRLPPERRSLLVAGREVAVHYRARRDGSLRLGAGGDDGEARVHNWSPSHIDLAIDGHRHSYRVTHRDGRLHLTGPSGGATLQLVPRFSLPEQEMPGGALVAPMPGRVVEVRVDAGSRVRAGEVLVVLEAMKMENHLRSATDGTVTEILVVPGDQVDKDELLLVIEDTT